MADAGLSGGNICSIPPSVHSDSLSIAFAFKASHNHFTLDRGGKVFKQTAPVIKLPDGASEDDHLALLGILNSSSICFWLRQSSQHQGGGASEHPWSWEDSYEFAGGIVENIPLPLNLPLAFGRKLDGLADQLAAVEPSAVCNAGIPTRDRLDAARAEHHSIRSQMIALQEELDWDVYHRYGLLVGDEAAGLVAEPGSVPNIDLGLRAFEIVLARKVASGEVETQWFARHRSTAVTEIPKEWPQEYRDVVARRIEMIERDRNIGLIERPECKRRWQSEPWEAKERDALTTWLLDRCEDRLLWYGPDDQPRPMTVNRLADRLRADADVVSVARLLVGPDADLADVLADDHRRRARPLPGPRPLQARGLGQARDLGADLGAAARRGPHRPAPRHHGPAQVHQRRLPQELLLAAPRQARRPQGALHLLSVLRPRQRRLHAAGLGLAGTTASRPTLSSPRSRSAPPPAAGTAPGSPRSSPA